MLCPGIQQSAVKLKKMMRYIILLLCTWATLLALHKLHIYPLPNSADEAMIQMRRVLMLVTLVWIVLGTPLYVWVWASPDEIPLHSLSKWGWFGFTMGCGPGAWILFAMMEFLQWALSLIRLR